MATSSRDSTLVNLTDEGDDEIPTNNETVFESSNMDAYVSMETDTDQLLQPEDESESNQNKESPFTFAFYIKLFDVDTEEITDRLKWSLFPRLDHTSSFAKKKIKPKPDLYGPFWICVTLVFSVAIAGNVSSYFQYKITKDNGGSHWHYDFHKVTLSAVIVFLYAALLPSGVFTALWSNAPKDSSSKPCFTELVCIVGYSLASLVPISILWLIQVSIVQWSLVIVSFFLSGGVLLLALKPIIEEFVEEKSKTYTIIAAILALHLLLAVGFMLCFFHVPSGNGEVVKAISTTEVIAGKTEHIAAIKKEEIKNNSSESKRDLNNIVQKETVHVNATVKTTTDAKEKMSEKKT